jgi:hypothetical protein
MSDKKDIIGNIIIITLLALLSVAGYLSYKSIDWTILKRLEAQPLVLPTPMPTNPNLASPSSTVQK